MVYLQDAESASRLAELDRHEIRRLSALQSILLKRTVARKVSGLLGVIASKSAAVYVAGGRLWLAIDGRAWYLSELQAEVDRTNGGYAVRISTPKRDYSLSVDESEFAEDTTPFVAAEDFSFGLWAANIIKSRDRQKVLLEVLVDASLDRVPRHAGDVADDGSISVRDSWRRLDHGESQERSPQ